jgi:NADH:ubiquinone oxidoreductase subunit 5 (subunit L)/multisubunit Na+/H+ antiporter MnhA subunit
MSAELHPAANHHLPAFIAPPGETDVLLTVMAVFLVVAVLAVGILFLRLHTLPERMAHRTHKLQFEIVAVLGLLALFTHIHAFWVAGLLLALSDLPDFGTPLRRMASSLERLAGTPPETLGGQPNSGLPDGHLAPAPGTRVMPERTRPVLAPVGTKELTHA